MTADPLHYDQSIAIPDIKLTGFMYGRRAPLTVFGPEGIEEMCDHFQAAFTWDLEQRGLVGFDLTGARFEAQLANISLAVHTTPEQAGYIFTHTGPRLAVYSHIIPPQTTAEELAEVTAPHYSGPLLTAEDFMTVTIGDEIVIGSARGEGTAEYEKSDVAPE
ncbi:hypothetical protein [Elongatibacter sediminis]|uniref:Uncharacterized protein n=1 Tax=Elongatibacter sediminis TaxID=3119006 RepID=A0AAW9R8M9_9GAMM